MRHPDGTSLFCPDGKCGGAACVRCTPLLKRRVENWWGPAERRRALAAFGNVLATVGSVCAASPGAAHGGRLRVTLGGWQRVWAYRESARRLKRACAKFANALEIERDATSIAHTAVAMERRAEAAEAEVERLRQRVENLSQQLAAVDAITVEHGRDEMLTRTEWLHAELARRDAAVPEPPPPQEREAVREAEALLCGAVVVAKDAADAEALRRLAARPVPVGPRAEQALARARIVDGAKLEAFAAATSPMTACDCDGFGPQCFGCRAFIDAAEAAHAALQPVTPCKQ